MTLPKATFFGNDLLEFLLQTANLGFIECNNQMKKPEGSWKFYLRVVATLTCEAWCWRVFEGSSIVGKFTGCLAYSECARVMYTLLQDFFYKKYHLGRIPLIQPKGDHGDILTFSTVSVSKAIWRDRKPCPMLAEVRIQHLNVTQGQLCPWPRCRWDGAKVTAIETPKVKNHQTFLKRNWLW